MVPLLFADVLAQMDTWEGKPVGAAVFTDSPHPILAAAGLLGRVTMGGARQADEEWGIAKYHVGQSAFIALDATRLVQAESMLGGMKLSFGSCTVAIESPPGRQTVKPEEVARFVGTKSHGLTHPAPRFTFLAGQFAGLLDRGVSMPVDDVLSRVRDRSFFQYLRSTYAGAPYYLDLGPYKAPDEEAAVLQAFERVADGDGGFGIRDNGIALALGFCLEVLQSPDSYTWTEES